MQTVIFQGCDLGEVLRFFDQVSPTYRSLINDEAVVVPYPRSTWEYSTVPWFPERR